MKKLLSLILIAGVVLVGAVGCSLKSDANIEGKLEDIMEKLYADIPEDERPMYLENMTVTEDNVESYIGTKDVKFDEMIASESMIGSIAHSVVLIRTSKGVDVEKAKKTIKENVDPRKWICVGIERDEVVVKSRGNLILVEIIQEKTNRDKISKAFDALK